MFTHMKDMDVAMGITMGLDEDHTRIIESELQTYKSPAGQENVPFFENMDQPFQRVIYQQYAESLEEAKATNEISYLEILKRIVVDLGYMCPRSKEQRIFSRRERANSRI